MLCREADHFRHVGQLVELVEQRFQLSRRQHPEQRAGRLVGLVEIAVRNAPRHANEVAGLGLHPYAVELEIEHAFLHEDELILRRMNVDGDELSGCAVGLEGESGFGQAFGK